MRDLSPSDPSTNDRRSFLKSMGVGAGLVGAAGAASTPVLLSAGSAGAVVRPAPGASGRFAIEIDGESAGILLAAGGGHEYSEVIESEEVGADGIVRKHIGNVKYEDISVTFGTGMKASFYDLITAMVGRNRSSVAGNVVAVTTTFMEHSRLSFFNALITEVSFPALDAASKDAAKMTVKLSPETTTFRHSHGKIELSSTTSKQKKWLVSNFRLDIKGLDCSKVSKIHTITIKQQVVELPENIVVAEQGASERLDCSNVVFTIADSASEQLWKWRANMIASGGEDTRNGTVTWLGPDLTTVIGTLDLGNLGVIRVAHESDEPNSDGIRRVKCEMYCEEVKFNFKAAWA